MPQDLPEAITIDITKLRIGQSIRVGDLETPGLKFLDPRSAVVVSVKMARGASKAAEMMKTKRKQKHNYPLFS